MGEAKRKSRSRSAIMAAEPRCIYCPAPPASVEHMPPVSMFRDRQRLSGLEFACCENCNAGTKAADAIAGFMAFIARPGTEKDWHTGQIMRLLSAVDQLAPGLRAELTEGRSRGGEKWIYTSSGILRKGYSANGSGPILKHHLDIFSAKLGMALYREHVGEPLPLHGRAYSRWFLNSGLTDETARSFFSILPTHETLQMGQRVATEQFAYRFNCDGKSILAALVGFHSNLHVLTVTTSEPDIYGPALTNRIGFLGVKGEFFEPMAPGSLTRAAA